MIIKSETYYKCECCGRIYFNEQEALKCEKKDKELIEQVNIIVESCKKLKELGSKIDFRFFPFYDKDSLLDIDNRIVKLILHNKDFQLLIDDDINSTIVNNLRGDSCEVVLDATTK